MAGAQIPAPPPRRRHGRRAHYRLGASGAAVAWSCRDAHEDRVLEQGDWIKPTDFPTNGPDWEARRYSDFHISPNRRARDTDYPVNDSNSPMKVANFNGVGGGTILYMGHFPRLHPSDFRVRTLDGVADDWPIDYWTLEPYFAENDRMMGVAGLAGDPAYPATSPPCRRCRSAGAARAMRRRSTNSAGIGGRPMSPWRRRNMTVAPSASISASARWAARKGRRRASTSPIGRMRCARGGVAHALPRARDNHQRAGHGLRRRLLRPERGGAVPAG